MFSDQFFEAKSFLNHLLYAAGPHGVHSPFVFDLITKILPARSIDEISKSIEEQRLKLLRDQSVVNVEDFGAGSRSMNSSQRKISQIARNTLQSPKCARVLFNLCNRFQPQNILELGTSLGITTSYLAQSNSSATVWTLEGATTISQRASQVFDALRLNNVKVVSGDFEKTLPGVLRDMKKVDFALVDGHHQYGPTLHYVEQIIEICHEHSIIILDDIHWSPGMKAAWDDIRAKKEISLSLDFFHFGFLFFCNALRKSISYFGCPEFNSSLSLSWHDLSTFDVLQN